MVKTIRVSQEFHELVAAHKHESETMEEALRRMVGGPSPEMLERALAGGDEDGAAELREIVEQGRERSRDRAAELRDRFEDAES
jgi:phosphoglycolate phosphatase-like HAD superfamily hydrolase